MRVVAHRGNSSVAPQNTLSAVEAAWRAQADAVEVDVHLTVDRQVVVIHDDTVDATTDGTGPVSGMDLETLRRLDAGSWFSPAYAGQRVPTLAELLALVRHRDLGMLLEVKGAWTVADVRLVTGPLLEAGLAERVVVQSFEASTVAALRDAAPTLRRALLIEAQPPEDVDALADALGVVALNPDGSLLLSDPGFVARQHAAGRAVAVWTLDEPWMWATAAELHVDAVITNRPDRLRGWLAARAVS